MTAKEDTFWRFSAATWVLGAITLALLIWVYSGGLHNLITRWNAEEEYSHGYFIPLVTLLLIWEQQSKLRQNQFVPSWLAPVIVFVALVILVLGELTALFLLIQFSFVLVLLGLSLALLGWRGSKFTYIPIALLLFAIPIPYFLESTLTTKLQLLSSKLGVELIRICKIPVFREGNLIDMGPLKLEVIEACSGLTYLYPLMWFGCLFAYLYRTIWWKRVVVILSTIPLAIVLNSLRIGTIGVLVNFFGSETAKGFLHDFEGWAVFMVCVGILLAEMWLLTFVGSDRRPFTEVFGLELPTRAQLKSRTYRVRPLSKPFLVTAAIISVTAGFSGFFHERTESIPARAFFSAFPMAIERWHGNTGALEDDILQRLGLADYVLADFKRGAEPRISLYVAYYDSQRKGTSPHSPLVCMPGGGWQITGLSRRSFPAPGIPDGEFPYNRAVIRSGETTELVYYWYQERGRRIASEYWAKWYLFRDALLANRSDGALVRVITPLVAGEPEQDADQRLSEFVTAVLPLLTQYVPN